MFILAFIAHNNWWFFQIICTDLRVSFWELLMNTTVTLLLSSTYKCIAFLLQISFWLEIRLLILLPFSTEKSIFYFQLRGRNVSVCGYRMKCVACKHCAMPLIKWGLCHTSSLPWWKPPKSSLLAMWGNQYGIVTHRHAVYREEHCNLLPLTVTLHTLASPPLFLPISLALLSSQVFIKTFIKSDMLLHGCMHGCIPEVLFPLPLLILLLVMPCFNYNLEDILLMVLPNF